VQTTVLSRYGRASDVLDWFMNDKVSGEKCLEMLGDIDPWFFDEKSKKLEAELKKTKWMLEYMDEALFADVHIADAEQAWDESEKTP
jgi:hypothetical protein